MSKKVKYVVKVDVSYVHLSLEFETSALACHFMDLFLDHMTSAGDGDKVSMYMERITLEDSNEQEGEE